MSLDTLAYLAQGYFHQDYDLLAPTPLDLIKVFVAKEDAETVADLRRDLDQLIEADAPEEYIRDVWLTQARSSYDPVPHGLTYREWIRQIRQAVERPSGPAR